MGRSLYGTELTEQEKPHVGQLCPWGPYTKI